VIGRLESDARLQAALLGGLGLASGAAVVLASRGTIAVPLAAVSVISAAAVALLIVVLRRLRFIIDRLRLIHPGAVPAEAPPPTRVSPAEVLDRVVPRVKHQPVEDIAFDPTTNRLWWYVPGFGVGSGGHSNILSMVAELERLGVRSTIVLTDVHSRDAAAGMRSAMCMNYAPTLAGVVTRTDVGTVPGDVLVATDWRSVRSVVEDRGPRRAHYFVQDHEVEFTATGTWSTLAADTYRAELRPVTLGRGLAELIGGRYGVEPAWTPIGIDPGIYGPNDPTLSAVVAAVRRANPHGLPVLVVYGRRDTARRGVELALAALELASQRDAQFFCVLFGEDVALDDVSFPWISVGVLPPRELAALYRAADLGVVLSLTNPSLVPQEMLACGLPVLEVDTPLTRVAFGELTGCHLTAPHPEALADALVELVSGADRGRLAPATVPTHAEAAEALHHELVGHTPAAGVKVLDGAPSVTVAIPTLDPDPVVFGRLLDALDAQRYPGRVELRVIDSGSQRPIEELLAGHRWPVHLHRTTRAEFRHGPTRNLLIEWSDTDLVALLTQDAVPVGDRWLFDLVAACTLDDRIGGAFSRHRPPVDAPRVAAVELVEHHDRLSGLHPSPATPRTAPIATDVHDAQFFFSNNGSILRRATWEQVPFRDVAFGEDQVWARDALRSGWSINYARHSIVEHLNVFTEAEEEDRAAVVHAWRLKYWAEPRGLPAIEARVAHELERAHRVVAEYGLDDVDLATEIRAVRARERGWRRALDASGSEEEWFRRL
jgi:hypothetical protein